MGGMLGLASAVCADPKEQMRRGRLELLLFLGRVSVSVRVRPSMHVRTRHMK